MGLTDKWIVPVSDTPFFDVETVMFIYELSDTEKDKISGYIAQNWETIVDIYKCFKEYYVYVDNYTKTPFFFVFSISILPAMALNDFDLDVLLNFMDTIPDLFLPRYVWWNFRF